MAAAVAPVRSQPWLRRFSDRNRPERLHAPTDQLPKNYPHPTFPGSSRHLGPGCGRICMARRLGIRLEPSSATSRPSATARSPSQGRCLQRTATMPWAICPCCVKSHNAVRYPVQNPPPWAACGRNRSGPVGRAVLQSAGQRRHNSVHRCSCRHSTGTSTNRTEAAAPSRGCVAFRPTAGPGRGSSY